MDSCEARDTGVLYPCTAPAATDNFR